MNSQVNDVEPAASRLCGRCRQSFPGDPTFPAGTQLDWWLCPSCHEALLGRTQKS